MYNISRIGVTRGDKMNAIYIALIVLAVILFIVGIVIGILQKKAAKKKVLLNTNTRAIEVLDEEPRTPRSIEKPMIISSEFVEESLEDDERN